MDATYTNDAEIADALKRDAAHPIDGGERNEQMPGLATVFASSTGEGPTVINVDAALRRQTNANPRFMHPDTFVTSRHEQGLDAFVCSTPKERLVELLGSVLAGVEHPKEPLLQFQFTPWQRLYMAAILDPASVLGSFSARFSLSIQQMRDIVAPTTHDPMHRTRGIDFEATAPRSMLRMTIMGTLFGSGKTALSMATGMALLAAHWERILYEHAGRQRGEIVLTEPRDKPMARLMLVVAKGNVFADFVSVVEGLIPVARRQWPHIKHVVVWKQRPRKDVRSVRVAANQPAGTMVIWFVTPSDMHQVRADTPGTAIPVMVVDEATEIPGTRNTLPQSPVAHTLCLAADLRLLCDLSGKRSPLMEFFDGNVIPPKDTKQLVKERQYARVEKVAKQRVFLEIAMNASIAFTSRVRNDLQSKIPATIHTHEVPSSRRTLSSALLQGNVDMLPADFGNVLLNYLRDLCPTEASIAQLRDRVCHAAVTTTDLIATVEGLQSYDPSIFPRTHPKTERLRQRIEEFGQACPICLMAPPPPSTHEGVTVAAVATGTGVATPMQMQLLGCCGYVACASCLSRCSSCPFCRKRIPSQLPRTEVPTVSTPARDSSSSEQHAPFVPGRTLQENLRERTPATNSQVEQVVQTLRVLEYHGRTRILVAIRSDRYGGYVDERILDALRPSGFQIEHLDSLIGGKGTKFASVKARFCNPDSPPMALVCHAIDNGALIGTNLPMVDGIVAAGDIQPRVLAQALGRVLRPSNTRDNTKEMVVVKIGCGWRRRRRTREEAGLD